MKKLLVSLVLLFSFSFAFTDEPESLEIEVGSVYSGISIQQYKDESRRTMPYHTEYDVMITSIEPVNENWGKITLFSQGISQTIFLKTTLGERSKVMLNSSLKNIGKNFKAGWVDKIEYNYLYLEPLVK